MALVWRCSVTAKRRRHGQIKKERDFKLLLITNFEYEDKINESKRVIKIVAPELLDVVLRNFDEMM